MRRGKLSCLRKRGVPVSVSSAPEFGTPSGPGAVPCPAELPAERAHAGRGLGKPLFPLPGKTRNRVPPVPRANPTTSALFRASSLGEDEAGPPAPTDSESFRRLRLPSPTLRSRRTRLRSRQTRSALGSARLGDHEARNDGGEPAEPDRGNERIRAVHQAPTDQIRPVARNEKEVVEPPRAEQPTFGELHDEAVDRELPALQGERLPTNRGIEESEAEPDPHEAVQGVVEPG